MFLLLVCFCFLSRVVECVTSIATPLYLYFQVLCQVLASNGRERKSYDCCPETDFVPFIEKFAENHQINFLIQIYFTTRSRRFP